MRKSIFATLLLLFPILHLHAQISRQVLFIGNSYTDVNNLPQLVADLATSFGDTLIHDRNTPGGYTFNLHNSNATTNAKIVQQAWDYVVLQEQSQLPSFSPGQVATDVFPYADSLVRKIRTNDSCTMPLFYMTWGRKNGDASNCAVYPPVCTYEGMQGRLRSSYLQMGSTHEAEVCPVGSAWWRTRLTNPAIELYAADESHPSLAGSYLAACSFYGAIFHKSCIGGYIPAGLDSATAMQLQTIAFNTLWDSLSTWNIDTAEVAAAFTATDNGGGNVQFTNGSSHATDYLWDFGDGSALNAGNSPAHTYANSGTYLVTLIAYRGCHTDTLMDSVSITIVGRENEWSTAVHLVPNPASHEITILGAPAGCGIEIISLQGKCLMKSTSATEKLNIESLPSGMYLLRLLTAEGQTLHSLKFEVLHP